MQEELEDTALDVGVPGEEHQDRRGSHRADPATVGTGRAAMTG
jgi:hypothetical protein